MADDERLTYPPLNTLKPVADDVWIVDGPVIRFGPWWARLPFPTRMTILRLRDGDLLIHSPTALDPALKTAVERLGRVRWIVGPNRIHYWWIPDWHAAFPQADIFLAPKIRQQAGDRITFDTQALAGDHGYPWDDQVATLPITGRYMTEVEFFHRASRTLVLTDLIESFEPDRLNSLPTRFLTWLGGARYPGGMPLDMRLTFLGHRHGLRDAVRTMIAWNPLRIIIAHGRWFDGGGQAELRRAFRWLL
jgi:hypothetical protein